MKIRLKRIIQCSMLVSFLTLFSISNVLYGKDLTGDNKATLNLISRKLLSVNYTQPTLAPFPSVNNTQQPSTINCSLPSIAEFPPDMFTQKDRSHGAISVHIIICLYVFWALAICCDHYFVGSIEIMCEKLQLQTDVAGASLMAIGSSAPELFVSIIGVFITKGDIGIGTILGSAVFNVLFVVGICGVVSSAALTLSWWPLSRDTFCYIVSLLVLTLVIFDGEVRWYESIIMISLYPLYVLLMYYNPRIERKMYNYIGDQESLQKRFSKRNSFSCRANQGENESLVMNQIRDTGEEERDDDYMSETSDAEKAPFVPANIRVIPRKTWQRIIWFISLPITIPYYFTIPNCEKESCKKLYLISFIVSILWIGVLTYVLVWKLTVIGFTLGIPDTVTGLTLVAFGSSVPDCLSSLVVALQGEGDMAVSHTIGSNVFDILLCLGLPWAVKTLIFEPDSSVTILSHGIFSSCFVILGSMIFAFFTMKCNKWKLDKKLGFFFLFTYAVFLVTAILLEMHIFKGLSTPECNFTE